MNPGATDDVSFEATVVGGGPGSPVKVRQSLLAPGFELAYATPPAFKLSSTLEPYLTWGDGSVGAGVPTPPTPWVVVSFRDQQPPIAVSAGSASLGWIVEGKPGQWTLHADRPLKGWIRLAAPLGLKPFPTNTAAELGEMVEHAKPILALLDKPAPTLVERRVTEEGGYSIISWTFDKPGALVPPAALLANAGGYPLRIESPLTRLKLATEDGPIAICQGDTLRIRFPCIPPPVGRALLDGAPTVAGVGTVSPLDEAGVAELALTILQGTADSQQLDAAAQVSEQFLSEADYAPEPNTRQSMPLQGDVRTDRLLAAHALLSQALASSQGRSEGLGGLVSSLIWTRDYATWKTRGATAADAGWVAAVCSVASLLGGTVESRAEAALLEAGIAAGVGLAKGGGQIADPFDLPLGRLRGQLFRYDGPPVLDGFGTGLLSPVRVVASFATTATKTATGFRLSWTAPDSRPYEIAVSGGNLKMVGSSGASANEDSSTTILRLRTTAEGPGWADLECGTPLPAWAPPPRFTQP